jgi:hypothetical protein
MNEDYHSGSSLRSFEREDADAGQSLAGNVADGQASRGLETETSF